MPRTAAAQARRGGARRTEVRSPSLSARRYAAARAQEIVEPRAPAGCAGCRGAAQRGAASARNVRVNRVSPPMLPVCVHCPRAETLSRPSALFADAAHALIERQRCRRSGTTPQDAVRSMAYSCRPGTSGTRCGGYTPQQVAQQRTHRMSAASTQRYAINRSMSANVRYSVRYFPPTNAAAQRLFASCVKERAAYAQQRAENGTARWRSATRASDNAARPLIPR